MSEISLNVKIDLKDIQWVKSKTINQNEYKFRKPYIYLLRLHDEIVYVGQTTNLKRRITEHSVNKCFNQVGLLQVEDSSERLMKELVLIKHFTPHYNVVGNASPSQIPLTDYTKKLQERVR